MSLFEKEFQRYFRADRIGRTCNPPRDHIREVDPELMLDNPASPHWVPKTTREEERRRMIAATQFSRALESLTRATPEDVQERIREQMMRRLKLQRSGELGNSWKQRRNLSKRASY